MFEMNNKGSLYFKVKTVGNSQNAAGPSKTRTKWRTGSKGKQPKEHKGRKAGSSSEHSHSKRTTGSCASSR